VRSFRFCLPPGHRATWINISNTPGSDRDPVFMPDSAAVLFASTRDGAQTDIYRYDILAGRLQQVTDTPENEFAPAVTPDGSYMSVIREEANGAKRLWRFDLHGARPELILEKVQPIEGYAWVDAARVAVVAGVSSGEPRTLQIASVATGAAETIATDVGRLVLKRPDADAINYVTSGRGVLKEYSLKTRATEDFGEPLYDWNVSWIPDGTEMIKAAGSHFYAHAPMTPELRAKELQRLGVVRGSAFRSAVVQEASLTGGRSSATAQPFGLIVAWRSLSNLATHVLDDRSPRIGTISSVVVSPNGRWLAFVAQPDSK
jgi:hypothetical protein